jgi:hypothetical protein
MPDLTPEQIADLAQVVRDTADYDNVGEYGGYGEIHDRWVVENPDEIAKAVIARYEALR